MIQLTNNDLPSWKGVDLTLTILVDLQALHSQLPWVVLFWLELLERNNWKGDVPPDKVGSAKKKVCKATAHFVELVGGWTFLLGCPSILYRADRVDMSCWGQDFWLHGVWDSLLS